jgi:outer membrane immunogenic protein
MLFASLSPAALADGIPVVAAPVAEECCKGNWTGFFGAASIGWARAGTDSSHEHTTDDGYDFYRFRSSRDDNADEIIGSVAIGYDRQIGDRFVVGIFADYTFGDFDSDHNNEYYDFGSFGHDNVWAVGGRVGITSSCCSLWYVTGGYTQANVDFRTEFAQVSPNIDGWFVGGGVEHQLYKGVSLKLEYRYSDFEDVLVHNVQYESCYCGTYETDRLDADSDIHSIRIGLAYKFGGHEEVPAPLK